jgi:hypothetical protein
MAIEKRIVFDRVEIDGDGRVHMKLQKQLVENGAVVFSEPHRSVIDPGVTPADQIEYVSANLKQMGWTDIPADAAAQITAHVKVAHTPEAITAWKAKTADEVKTLRKDAEAPAKVKG